MILLTSIYNLASIGTNYEAITISKICAFEIYDLQYFILITVNLNNNLNNFKILYFLYIQFLDLLILKQNEWVNKTIFNFVL